MISKARTRVFVAYRRDGGTELAWLVRDALGERGYDVLMDMEALRSGPVDAALLKEIESSTDVVVVLAPGSLDACATDGDWFRLVIAHAIQCGRRVIPVVGRGFRWPPCALPEDIAVLPSLQGVVLGHDFCAVGVDHLTALLVGAPTGRYWRVAWLAALPVVSTVLFAALLAWPVLNESPTDCTAADIPGQIESVVKEAVDSVELQERTVEFTGYEDRDHSGLYLAHIGAPTRTELGPLNHRQVWAVFLGYLKGREIEPLLAFLSQATTEWERVKALALLSRSAAATPERPLDEQVASVAVQYLGQGTAVQKAALSVLRASRIDPRQKWDLVSARLNSVSDDALGSAYREIEQWVPAEERGDACNDMLRVFVQTRSDWAACDLAYAMRKLNCVELLPVVRNELSNTLNARKAWYLARLVADFEDRDAAPALRAAFSRHYRYTIYAVDIAEVLVGVEGDTAIPFLVATGLSGSEELLMDMARDHSVGIPAISKQLRAVLKSGTGEQRIRAREVLRRLNASEPRR